MRKILTLLIFLGSFFSPLYADQKKPPSIPMEDLQRFTTVIDHIKNYYVEEAKDPSLFENAIRGMLAGLDPHSAYFNEEEFAELKISTSGKFVGLGIKVTLENGLIRVISPIDDTPAQKAGVQPGDLIVRLNETPVKGLTLKKAVEMMRGKRGSAILLTILREKENKPLQISVTRDIVKTKSVKHKSLAPGYGYVRISQFQSDTGPMFIKALESFKQDHNGKIKGLILDLRNNPGGILEASVEVANAFLDKRKLKNPIIMYAKGRINSSKIEEKANNGDLLDGAPIVVLINTGSASASEIVAGALQDHKRAVIMGEKSFGKGSVQTILPLKDQRGLKLTTALYYTPSGRSIQAEGVSPDIEIKPVEILKPKTQESAFLLREEDFEGHLKNTKKQTNKKAKLEIKEDLIYQDYPLHEALTLLKGLDLARK